MHSVIYTFYSRSKKILKEFQTSKNETGDELLDEMISDLELSLNALEKINPELKEDYERLQAICQSFSSAQIDHICYQIGEWYIQWKEKMWVDGKPNQHFLGQAKEELKTMICGG